MSHNPSEPDVPVVQIVPPSRWYFLGDSQTAGRAVETSAIAPPVVFHTVWIDSGLAAPSYVYRNGGSGRSLANTYLHYQGQNIPSTPWVHIQESGWINDAGQETPEAYVATYETFFNDIRNEFPEALITCETSFSYRREAEAYRDWTNHNIALKAKVDQLNANGMNIILMDVDSYIELGLLEFNYADLCIPPGEANAHHYTGLGNFLVAMVMFKYLGYDITQLNHSSILLDETNKARVIGVVSGVVDIEAPTVPSDLQVSAITQSGFTLSWSASSDNVGVTLYEVLVNGNPVATSNGTSVGITTLQAGTTYTVAVRARDARANWSAPSATIQVTTESSSDIESPTVPTGLVASDVTHESITLVWDASTDNVGVTLYEVRRGGVSQGTTAALSMVQVGLTPETFYDFQVRARDAAGNWSDWSATTSVTTTTAPVIPTVIWEDDFERSDVVGVENIGGGWERQGGSGASATAQDADLVNGQLVRRPGSNEGYSRLGTYTSVTLPADFALEVDVPNATVGSWLGFYARWNGTTGVRWMINGGTITLGTADSHNSGDVTLTTVAAIPSSWGTQGTNTVRMEFSGTTSRLYLNGVHVRTGTISTNSTLVGGAVGICGQAQNRAFESVRVMAL